MFSKSIIKHQETEPPVTGRVLFNGNVEVRTSPINPPRNLRKRLEKGDDVIAIWFQHVYAEMSKQLDDTHDIKIMAKDGRQNGIVPKIGDMSCREILEFCKAIDVHPGHLVPMDDDIKMTLPTPLLELLIDMAYGGEFSKGLNLNELYLASNAIFFEGRRVKEYMKAEKKQAAKNGDRFSTLAAVFKDVLSDEHASKAIANTTVIVPETTAAFNAGRGYPYMERVMDIALFQTERPLDASNEKLQIKRQIMRGHIDGFIKEYQKVVHSGWNFEIDASDLLLDILESHDAHKHGYHTRKIMHLVEHHLKTHLPLTRQYAVAQNQYEKIANVAMLGATSHGQQYLHEIEPGRYDELASAVLAVLIAKKSMQVVQQAHEEEEGKYITRTAKIRAAFEKIDDPKICNLLNNRAVLCLHNIRVEEVTPTYMSPK